MKESYYFSHDYNARHDPKLARLLSQKGIEAIGAYWCIAEMLYEQGGYLEVADCERIAYELRTHCDLIKYIIQSDLFEIVSEKFCSRTVLNRLKLRKTKSEKARKSVMRRWEKPHTNVLRTQNDGNTIKERKGKEKKVNISSYEDIETPASEMQKFVTLVQERGEGYQELLRSFESFAGAASEIEAFVSYWTELTLNGKKQLWQTKDTFEVKRRLSTWFQNAGKFSSKKGQPKTVTIIK